MADKTGTEPEPSSSAPDRGAGGRFAKGNRANPKGRPRTGLALAERIRERLDPDKLLDLAARLADDESVSLKERLAALTALAQLGYSKPPSEINAHVTASAGQQRTFANLTDDELRLEIARRRALLAAPADVDSDENE